MLTDLQTWFSGLEQRERLILVLGTVFVLITFGYLGVVEPVAKSHASLEQRVTAKRSLLSWMNNSATEIISLRRSTPATANRSGGSLLAIVDNAARSAGLSSAVRRIDQDGDDAVRVRLEAAPFDDVLMWLDNLKRQYGVIVSLLNIDKNDAAGTINATLTLARAG
ncbi:MAG: type II secretion system protein M [Gammaproteobacteria bacterium]|nr:type II secretion system protein M [Gammaproteobacteria bacterium]